MHPGPAQRLWSQSRMASTSTHPPFPFPTHARPTPHQIFHLPPGATQQEIKARYYDLVRVHHPDSPMCRGLASDVRHARFRAITAAYDTLRGKGKHAANAHDAVRAELERRRRAQEWHRHREQAAFAGAGAAFHPDSPWEADADDRWKDWLIIAAGVISLAAGVAAKNLADARREAKTHGAERRQEIKRHVEENKRLQPEGAEASQKLDNS